MSDEARREVPATVKARRARERFAGLRTALRLVFRRLVAIYFRDVEVAGAIPTKGTEGRLFAANHTNALVDPILVLTQVPCDVSPVAKSTLWKIPGLKWLLEAADAVPIVRRRDVPGKSESDNDAVFARVAVHLASGGNLLIFPEGTSHNEPHLLALRSGAGRMLARSCAEEGAVPLTFQAVALEFDEREVFRSRTLVLFGPVRAVDDLDVDPHDADAVSKAITDVLHADLSELLVEGKTWEERVLIVHVAEMFANDAKDTSLEQLNVLGRRIEQARRVLVATDPEILKTVEQKVSAYFQKLADEEVTDEAVAKVARGGASPLDGDRLARAAGMILALPLALAAAVLYWVPYQLPRAVSKRLKGKPDESSTYKLGVGLLVYPIWAAILIGVAFWKLPTFEAAFATSFILACPFAALPWLDRWDRMAASVRMLAPSEERRERLQKLAGERTALLAEIDVAREKAESTPMLVDPDASAPAAHA
jgi:glycerol-3-phosphate O-acyltransferase / dihydroxyacetone phosphate acyltransferase